MNKKCIGVRQMIKKGDIYTVQLHTKKGSHIQSGIRPVIVVSGNQKNKTEAKTVPVKKETATNIKSTATEAVSVQSETDNEVDEQTVAIIMAALMAYYQTNNPKCEFTVKRIKRI
jgi:mRNA-degrading endonuclease toxin of MazEF toxin-antitoxin module